ncbi:uncharacterized protein LOC134186741 isoform X2 [Corticium candelabrum]|uniref:uncharacterized protein LOC134186741 isoform X2 n=1 Tax=Corticium candelabrum TaxID=121492 RepID=UPI002E265D27|nr:uncharacterized protein LOC134186741 isoform X2 [Corticium candelabrum]
MADDEVPPLEDMSEMLAAAAKLRENKGKWQHMRLGLEGDGKTTESTSNTKVENGQDSEGGDGGASHVSREEIRTDQELKSQRAAPSAAASASSSNEFCGMKKGFLLDGARKKKSKSKATASTKSQKAESDIPYIKPTQTKEESRYLPEVQEVMKNVKTMLEGREWITDSLIDKLIKNPVVGPKLSNPSFATVIARLQQNPQQAFKDYSGDPEVGTFLKEVSRLIGDHFTSLGGQPNPPVKRAAAADSRQAKDEETMKKVLARADVREVLNDPNIQELIRQLRHDPDKAQQLLTRFRMDPDFSKKISKLIEVGILGTTR